MRVSQAQKQVIYRACNICEAICGLEITLENNTIVKIKGDQDDPLSKGHICPKAIALKDIYNDPDRLKVPIKRQADGWQEISWKQAYQEVVAHLQAIQKQYGNDAVAVYQGNPSVHNLEAMLFAPSLVRALKTKNRFSATSVDQLPDQLASYLMFGHGLFIPLPDLDHTDFLLIIGANPVVSNGSMMTAPGIPRRLKAIRKRGGKVYVVDPRRTETSQLADEHIFIRPGTDALMLLSMLHIIFKQSKQRLDHLEEFCEGLTVVESLVEPYPAEKTAAITGIPAAQLEQLVDTFCASEKACCYGRIGVSTHEFGSLAHYLINVLNIVTGQLDKVGGTMFAQPAFDFLASARKKPKKSFANNFTRVRKLPDFNGEFPVASLAEEILTPGEGQIKALLISSGNPVSSTPNSQNLDQALDQLEYIVSIDFYLNETSRKANIILPPPYALERPHYDLVFHALAIRNTSRYSQAIFSPPKQQQSDADIFIELTGRMQGAGLINSLATRLKKWFVKSIGIERIIDHHLKKGPYASSHQLSLKKINQNPHGIDLGAMKPCLPQRLFTENKTINLAPDKIIVDAKRLEAHFFDDQIKPENSDFDLLLIGRRNPRSNNSWLHNSYRLVKGKKRCLAFMHPQDARQRKLDEGELVRVKSRAGQIEIEVHITEDIMQGVVSVPHGWGHDMKGVKLNIATQHAGVNINRLTDELLIDQVSGNAALNGVPIAVEKIAHAVA
ncbi:MAG: molybdopterin oxidoreductase family protein [bacterium]